MPTRRIPLVLLLALTVAACSSDSPTDNGNNGNNGNNNNNGGTFKNEVAGTVNGSQWTASNSIATRTDAGGLVILTFTAYGPNDSHISFGITNASVRTFSIDGGPVQADIKYADESYGKDENGSIKIDVLTTAGMKGSFTINAKSSSGESGTATCNFDVEF